MSLHVYYFYAENACTPTLPVIMTKFVTFYPVIVTKFVTFCPVIVTKIVYFYPVIVT